jgi:hypothetical protein
MALTFKPNNNTVPKNPSETKETVYKIRTIFEKTIELDELSMPANKQGDAHKNEDVASIEYPFIKINDYIFSRSELDSVTIDCTGFVPKIAVHVKMLSQLFLAKEMPKDGDIISIAIRNKSDVLKIIRNDYIITGVHTAPNMTDSTTPVLMSFFGELFIQGLDSNKYDFSFEGTSYDALKDFAKKYGLGFSSNEDNTNDKQVWIKANMSGEEYIKKITSRAWRDAQSFYNAWIDIYYNLNFVNINKQLISAENEVDVGTLTSNVDKEWNYGLDSSEEQTLATVKVFSNFIQFKTTPFYINTWRPINRSSTITFQIGAKMNCRMFEHNYNLYNNSASQKYWSVPVEPTYDSQKSKSMILLRGRATYVQSNPNDDDPNPQLKRANYPYIDIYEKFPWLGIQYTISNPDDDNLKWDGNHHRNYQVAKVKNLINNKELDKLNVHIQIVGNNLNIIRGDKMPLALIRTDVFENMKINPDSNFNDALDLFYSGWYLIKGFKLSWSGSNEQTITSNFSQEFILTRREWPPPEAVEPIKTTVENKQ